MAPETFRALRAQTGLSQGGLADKLGISRPTVARYEAGEREIPGDIADLLDTFAQPDTVQPDTIVSKAAPIVSVPELSKLTPWTVTNIPSRAWRPIDESRWQRVGHRIVSAKIPEPIPYEAPSWAGWRGIITKSGRVFDYETGAEMRELGVSPRPDGPTPGSRSQLTKRYKSAA
jgi:transcriptional regulator with XRE-family HTH domain